MKKVVLKSTMEDERSKRRAMKAVVGVGGLLYHPYCSVSADSIAVDIKEGKITLIGEADPVSLTTKLRKIGFRADLLSVGPAKEEKKGDQGPAKEENKEAEKKKQEKKDAEPAVTPTVHVYPSSHRPYDEGYRYTVVREEYPANTCTII